MHRIATFGALLLGALYSPKLATAVENRLSRQRKVADAALMTLSAAGVIGALLLLFSLRRVALLAYAAILAAVIFSALANAVSRRTPLPRGLMVLVVPIVLIAIIALVVSLAGSEAASQFDDLRERLPSVLDSLDKYLPNGTAEETIAENMPDGSTVAGWITVIADLIRSAVTGIIVALLGGIYLAANPQTYRNGLGALFPQSLQDSVSDVLTKLYEGLKHWLLGQLASMAIIGTMVYIGLAVLGVPGALALALLAGLLEFIPLVGPFIAAVLPILAALTVSPQLALYTAGFFLVLQQIEGNLLSPIIMKHAVSIPPAVTLLSLLVIGALFGPLGLLLGGPLTVAGFIMVRELWVDRVMEHHDGAPDLPLSKTSDHTQSE
jgi:predicted PurR-regulated permease PerM